MPFVLDASVALAWCFEDEAIPYADQILDSLDSDTGLVPAIWPLEIANAVLAAERRGRLQTADTVRFIELVRALPITVDDIDAERAMGSVLDMARAYNLTSYNAAYLELAMREGLPLATQDRRLAEAAAHCGVPLMAV
jgi:predicted nucleic acid-binding protein